MSVNSSQKNSQKIPKLRFAYFADEWEEKKIEMIAKVNPSQENLPSEFIYIDLESVDSGVFKHKNKIKKTEAPSRAQRILQKNDILFQMVRPYQRNNLFFNFDGDYVASTGYAQIRAKQDPMFLYQYLHTRNFLNKVLVRCTGSGYPAINSNDLKKIRINFPSFPEQQKIAEFLETVDKYIENLKAQKKSFLSYKKGMLQKIFSQAIRFKDDKGKDFPEWEEKRLGEVFNITAGKTKSQHIILTGKNIIVDMGGISSDGKLIANKTTNYSGDFLSVNDLVMPKDDIGGGFIIGRVAKIPFDNKYICGDHIFKLTKIYGDIEYLFYVINSFVVSASLRKKANGTAQLGLGKSEVQNQTVPFPILHEQQKISAFLNSIDNLVEEKQKQIIQAEKWKKGLMQGLFV